MKKENSDTSWGKEYDKGYYDGIIYALKNFAPRIYWQIIYDKEIKKHLLSEK